jgi:hypothetical protein
MEWNDNTLIRLSEIFGSKSKEIRNSLGVSGSYSDMNSEYDTAWKEYVSNLGLNMVLLERDFGQHLTYFLDDSTKMVRIVNAWNDRYIDMTEDFAIKVLTLGFLP